jgi:hypothetical protein
MQKKMAELSRFSANASLKHKIPVKCWFTSQKTEKEIP